MSRRKNKNNNKSERENVTDNEEYNTEGPVEQSSGAALFSAFSGGLGEASVGVNVTHRPKMLKGGPGMQPAHLIEVKPFLGLLSWTLEAEDKAPKSVDRLLPDIVEFWTKDIALDATLTPMSLMGHLWDRNIWEVMEVHMRSNDIRFAETVSRNNTIQYIACLTLMHIIAASYRQCLSTVWESPFSTGVNYFRKEFASRGYRAAKYKAYLEDMVSTLDRLPYFPAAVGEITRMLTPYMSDSGSIVFPKYDLSKNMLYDREFNEMVYLYEHFTTLAECVSTQLPFVSQAFYFYLPFSNLGTTAYSEDMLPVANPVAITNFWNSDLDLSITDGGVNSTKFEIKQHITEWSDFYEYGVVAQSLPYTASYQWNSDHGFYHLSEELTPYHVLSSCVRLKGSDNEHIVISPHGIFASGVLYSTDYNEVNEANVISYVGASAFMDESLCGPASSRARYSGLMKNIHNSQVSYQEYRDLLTVFTNNIFAAPLISQAVMEKAGQGM